MSLPIIEQITQHLVDTLQGVSVLTGFNSTLIVERATRAGNLPKDQKCVVAQGDPTKVANPAIKHHEWRQPYSIVCYVLESDDSTTPLDQRANVIRADVEMAVMRDAHRGGLAIDTIVEEPEMFDAENGEASGIIVNLTVHYRTLMDNPYEQ